MNVFEKKDYFVFMLALVIGILGMGLYLTGYHLWLDHKFVDSIREQIINQQNQQKK